MTTEQQLLDKIYDLWIGYAQAVGYVPKGLEEVDALIKQHKRTVDTINKQVPSSVKVAMARKALDVLHELRAGKHTDVLFDINEPGAADYFASLFHGRCQAAKVTTGRLITITVRKPRKEKQSK